ncbi:MAG: LacI family DNA-binding transcriptional regulator [bacterium]|nr:LacI family DNA-binding transcriptional regulator [bacterium]
MSAPSIREIARSLGLSHTTVSEAIRDSPRVNEVTRKRVQKAAKAVGYRPNPLAGALMSEMRRARSGTFRGVLAILDLDGPDRRPASSNRYHRELARGATARAAELGFKAETIVTGTQGISDTRLDTILQARGIRGLLLLPIAGDADISGLDWTHFSGIYTDYLIERPALHAVCPDHYRSMVFAVQKLHTLGYHRLGLVLQASHDARLLHRWEAAFHAYHEHHAQKEALPPLILPEWDKKAFIRWFKTKKPDAVLCHRAEVIEWMEACGAKIPETHGFCCLNVASNTRPCSGLDLQPGLLGARGVELLIAALHRNDCGVPDHPSTTTIPAVWVDGPTKKPA